MPELDHDTRQPRSASNEETTTSEPATRASRSRTTAPVDAEARYARGDVLGAGAMGAVHQCEDRALEREVAVKVMKGPLAAHADMRARFAREARLQGKLEHPGIVPVHDFGVGDDGAPYFTMKRVRGRSLRAILDDAKAGARDERATPRRLLGAFATVCVTVAFAHSRGVVHRDIKPSNVMLGDFGEVYLLDWGIAKEVGDDPLAPEVTHPPGGLHAASLGAETAAGDMLGTVGYMPPEQLRGDAVDERADVYALGAVLFEILTLQRLHRGTAKEAMDSTVLGVDARPSRRAGASDWAEAFPELEALCVRATSLDPAARPTAREMHAVLERVLDGARHDERSRDLSADHVARARVEIATLPGGGPAARERAVNELHRAIVLDGTNAEALVLLHRLADERAVEHEVDAAAKVDASASRAHRIIARSIAALFVPWLLSIVLIFPSHARSPGVLGLLIAAIAVTTGLATWRAFRTDLWIVYAAVTTGLFACALEGAIFGPFILVPTQLAFAGVIFGMTASSTGKLPIRRFVRIGSVVAFLAPLLLEALGVLPPSYELRADGLFVFARAAELLPAADTTRYLICFNVALIVIPGVVVERMRAHEIRVERRAFEAAARMSGLLPKAARLAGLTGARDGESAR